MLVCLPHLPESFGSGRQCMHAILSVRIEPSDVLSEQVHARLEAGCGNHVDENGVAQFINRNAMEWRRLTRIGEEAIAVVDQMKQTWQQLLLVPKNRRRGFRIEEHWRKIAPTQVEAQQQAIQNSAERRYKRIGHDVGVQVGDFLNRRLKPKMRGVDLPHDPIKPNHFAIR